MPHVIKSLGKFFPRIGKSLCWAASFHSGRPLCRAQTHKPIVIVGRTPPGGDKIISRKEQSKSMIIVVSNLFSIN